MKTMRKLKFIPILLTTFLLISSCDVLMAEEDESLSASGVIEANDVVVSSEMSGRVAEVYKEEGEFVESGEILFRLEDTLLQAQRDQAVAALKFALAQVDSANTGLNAALVAMEAAATGVDSAQLQYELALDDARLVEQQERVSTWNQKIPREFTLPNWYFQKPEVISAAEAEVKEARETYETELANFESTLDEASNADLRKAEERLLQAQVAFMIAEELSDRKIEREGKEELEEYLEIMYDDTEAELEAAQAAYDKILSDQASADVLEARARLAAARERYETTLDQFNAQLTGEHSKALLALEIGIIQSETAVSLAQANIIQAENGVAQAERMVAQAQAALDMIDLQMEKLEIASAVSGVVLNRNIEPGEVIQPGMTAFTIGLLDHMTIKVYVPENLYGQINLGDQVNVQVDSFPGQIFMAQVVRIADRAEFTPRNVQTQEDRQTTVYEIELAFNDPEGKLKPGMPADVVFK